MNIDILLSAIASIAVVINTIIISRMNAKVSRVEINAVDTNQRMVKTEENVAIVERATNSMKDALVASTERSAMAEGHAVGLAEGRHEADDQRMREDLDRQQLATPPAAPTVIIVPPHPPSVPPEA